MEQNIVLLNSKNEYKIMREGQWGKSVYALMLFWILPVAL